MSPGKKAYLAGCNPPLRMDEEALVDAVAELMKKHRGKANAIKSAEIAKKFGIPDNDTTRQTRHIIKQAMEKHVLPIGGLSNGYFVVENRQELAECALDLENRIDRTEERLALLKRTFESVHGGAGPEDEAE